jgi:hypothetical protein
MTSKAHEYTITSRELLAKAEEALSQDDLIQASEKAGVLLPTWSKELPKRRAGGTTATASFTRW